MTRSNADIAPSAALTIRHIGPGDVEALRMLAQLDSSREPTGEILVADVGGELWAATSVEDRHTVADPFRPTRELVSLLDERARQLRHAGRRPAPLPGGAPPPPPARRPPAPPAFPPLRAGDRGLARGSVARLSELPEIANDSGRWQPLNQRLGITAFGLNGVVRDPEDTA